MTHLARLYESDHSFCTVMLTVFVNLLSFMEQTTKNQTDIRHALRRNLMNKHYVNMNVYKS